MSPAALKDIKKFEELPETDEKNEIMKQLDEISFLDFYLLICDYINKVDKVAN